MGILNSLRAVLESKYPDKKVKVKIEQEGLKVTVIIEKLWLNMG